MVPAGAIPACHPCYPGGLPIAWQRWWPSGHRSSSPDNGVDALSEVDEATPGFAARYGLQGCALTSVSIRQGTRCSGLPRTPPSSYPGALPAPGAGLPPASSNVSTAYCPVPILAPNDASTSPGDLESPAQDAPSGLQTARCACDIRDMRGSTSGRPGGTSRGCHGLPPSQEAIRGSSDPTRGPSGVPGGSPQRATGG